MAKAAKFCCLLGLEHGPMVHVRLHQLSFFQWFLLPLPKLDSPEIRSIGLTGLCLSLSPESWG